MRNPNEIEQSLAELEGELEQLNTRRTDMLKQITDLTQGMISSHSEEENDPQPINLVPFKNLTPSIYARNRQPCSIFHCW
jgi:hypothetical protein